MKDQKTTQQIRNGRGRRNYERERDALKRYYKANNLPCKGCGQPFDWTITNHNDRFYFTADHPIPLAHGGSLTGQKLEGFHRSCNSSKNNKVIPKGNVPTTDPFG